MSIWVSLYMTKPFFCRVSFYQINANDKKSVVFYLNWKSGCLLSKIVVTYLNGKNCLFFYLTKKSYFWTTTFNVTTARFKRPKRMKVPSSFLFFLFFPLFPFFCFSFLFFSLVVFTVLALFWWRHAKIMKVKTNACPLPFFLSLS